MNCPDDSVHCESDISDERSTTQSTRKRIKANFQFARPPPKAHQRLRLTPKLLLQIQQLVLNRRPVPVLEIWQPGVRKSHLTQHFPQLRKLAATDIYGTLYEPYISQNACSAQIQSEAQGKREKSAQDEDIVAVLCQAAASGDTTVSSAIHFRDAQSTWHASASTALCEHSTLCYQFVIKNDENRSLRSSSMIMRWEKRPLPTNGDSPSSGSSEKDHFVLLFIDRKERHKSRIATMSRGRIHITVRKCCIIDRLQTYMSLTNPMWTPTNSNDNPYERLENWLYTHVLTSGIWVAFQEKWLS